MVNTAKKLLFALMTSLLLLLPLQTLLTVWLSKEFGHLYVWSAWKEVLILIATAISVVLYCHNGKLRTYLNTQRYNQVAVVYLALLTIYLAFSAHDNRALVSVAQHGRYILIFLIAQIAAWYYPKSYRTWSLVIVVTALASALFGLLQVLVLSPDFLVRFGYDPVGVQTSGIPPAMHRVAANIEVYRAQAGLRGPNAFGAYLILPFLLCSQKLWQQRANKYLLALIVLGAGLYVSYSRSAWLGLLLALGLAVALYAPRKVRHAIMATGLTLLVVSCLGLALFRHSAFVQSIVLHENQTATVTQSNEGHFNLTKQGGLDVIHHPLGSGLGTAGPASALGGVTKIAENYFLQVGQEVGWLGLVLLLGFHGVVFLALWRRRHSGVVPAVLLAMVALTATNFLLHTWTDEAVAISFWVIAGSCLGPIKTKT